MEPLGRFPRTGPGSSSMEPLDQFRFRFYGTVGPVPVQTRGALAPVHEVFFRQFNGSAIQAGSEPIANGFGSGFCS